MWFDLNSEMYFLISSESDYPKKKWLGEKGKIKDMKT